MYIKNKPNFISIIVDNYEFFNTISNDIKNDIKNSIIRENKIIIFPTKNNIINKMNLIAKIASKNELKEINNNDIIKKNIMIFLDINNSLNPIYNFDIKINKNYNNIKIKHDFIINKKMIIYFQTIFKKYDISFNDYFMEIKSKNNETNSIKKIIDRLEIKNSIFGLLCKFNVKLDSRSHINNISTLLDTEFKALNLDVYDNYDSFKRKYKSLSRKYHPDLNRFDNELLNKIYQKRFQKIQIAYKELKDFYKQGMVA